MAERKYSDQQRAALAAAYSQPGVTDKRVAAMAAAGELVDADGQPLEPFAIPASTVRDIARAERRSAARPSLAGVPHGDAIEMLRQRAVDLADAELAAVEAEQAGKRDAERVRRAIRCVADAARIPAPPPPPSRPEPDRDASTPSPDGIGALIREHRSSPPPPGQESQPTAPPEPEPAPVLSREERLAQVADNATARLRADLDRVREQQAEAPPVDDTARLEERTRRGQPREDTDSIVPGSFSRAEPEPKPYEPTAREAMRYGSHLVARDRLKGHL